MRIEDRLNTGARRLRVDIEATIAPDDVEDALSSTTDPGTRGGSWWFPRPALLVAAAVVVLAVAAALLASGAGDEQLVADEGDSAPSAEPTPDTSGQNPADIPVEIVGEFPATDAELGSIAFFGVEEFLVDQLALTGAEQPVPDVDFEQDVVLAFTVSGQARCRGPLVGLDVADAVVRPHFADADDATCVPSDSPYTFLLAVARDELPGSFNFALDTTLLDEEGPAALSIHTTGNFWSYTPEAGSDPAPTSDGPDLERPEQGREITFDRIGDVMLGQTLGPTEFYEYEGLSGSCGYWGMDEPSHDGDEPLNGLVSIDGDTATIKSIMVRGNPRYRTASGVGVGTSLATLERIYGADLVVARTDAPRTPEGLRAQYGDVAAVRNGDRALTFYLSGDIVRTVKLSNADFWGDDEGCA